MGDRLETVYGQHIGVLVKNEKKVKEVKFYVIFITISYTVLTLLIYSNCVNFMNFVTRHKSFESYLQIKVILLQYQ